jgi:hypothetical protein
VLQPEPDAPGQSRKTQALETARTAYLCGISRQGSTHPESSDLTYKEGVAGSNPASPTSIKLDFAGKTQVAFAVSALQGAVASAPVLGNLAGGETTARLRDLARASDEHRRCTDLQRRGIEYLAEDKLAAARNSLVQPQAAPNALLSMTWPRKGQRQ